MITVVQFRVLRKMLEANVMITSSGGAFFRELDDGESVDGVRKQTILALEDKGLVEDIATRWGRNEYRITDAGREVAGGVPSSVVKLVREAMEHVAIIQEIVERSYVLDEEVDIIREEADEAQRSLLAADVILSEGVYSAKEIES